MAGHSPPKTGVNALLTRPSIVLLSCKDVDARHKAGHDEGAAFVAKGEQLMTKGDLVGVYRTLGDDTVSADGTFTRDESRTAQIMYSPDGYMAVVSMPNGRKLAAKTSGGPDLNAATPEERAEAAKGMVCYAGRYELKDGLLHHHVEMALNPNAVGQTIIRRPELDGADLTLSSIPDANGNFRRIRWRRVAGDAEAPGIPQMLQSFGRLGRRMLAEFRHDFLR
jgi:hypothetical protein